MQTAREISHHDAYDTLWSHTREVLFNFGLQGAFTLKRLHGGANNQVFRVDLDDKKLLLKFYFRHPDDQRDRLGTEFSFLDFAWSKGLRCIPKPLGLDRKYGLGLYEFLLGMPLRPGQIGENEVRQAADFVHLLNEHKASGHARNLPNASEACFSLDEHEKTIEDRVKRLENVQFTMEPEPHVVDFIRSELRPAWDRIKSEFGKETQKLGTIMDEVIGLEERCISPSDFGFHNAIMESSGYVRFFDFEYAGWDDPAKLICDFFCQPKVPVPKEWNGIFVERATINFARPERLLKRVRLLTPLYRLKWCCIALNECLPDGRARRQFAGAVPLSSDAAQPFCVGDQVIPVARSLLMTAIADTDQRQD